MEDKKQTKTDPNKVPLIYLYIYRTLRENFKVGQPITYKCLVFRFKQIIYHIPRKYYDIAIKELIDLGLMETLEGGRSPVYKLNEKDYESLFLDLEKLKKSTQRFKILNSRYQKLLKIIEKEEKFNQKYLLLECDYKKQLRKLELKKLEGSHYW